MKSIPFLVLIALLMTACSSSQKAVVAPTMGEQVVSQAIQAHGGKKFDQAHYSFEFRGTEFSLQFEEGGRYRYTRKAVKDEKTTFDVMTNDQFERMINGSPQEIKAEDLVKYRNSSINSVIYFALLPYKLDDPAVHKAYKGELTIKHKLYDVVEVTFAEEGGGKDHEDTFMYWIGKEDHIVDYLAYNYKVNKGGVRFRSAYNPRIVDGIRFQDYVNYKAPLGTALQDLPVMYEAGQLEELSKIELKNVKTVLQ